MKPFNSIEEARAELAAMPTESLRILNNMTSEALQAGLITQEQFDLVMDIILAEAMVRMDNAIDSIMASEEAETATFH
jgi:hypothetical protein